MEVKIQMGLPIKETAKKVDEINLDEDKKRRLQVLSYRT